MSAYILEKAKSPQSLYRPTINLYVDHPAITANAASTAIIAPNHA